MSLAPDLGTPCTPVIVTGGASGIGRASAEALAAVGRPVAIWDIDHERAAAAAESIARDHAVATTSVAIDLAGLSSIDTALSASKAALGSIGGVVHAAGIVDTQSIDGISSETWDRGIGVNLRALAFLVQRALPELAANPGSAVVAIASINATLGNAINPIYSASKGGVLSLVRSLADRLAGDGIRINAVSPGQIATPMLQPALDALPQGWFEKRILLARLGRPDEVGRLVRFLLSAEASYITGAELVIDGGNISSQR